MSRKKMYNRALWLRSCDPESPVQTLPQLRFFFTLIPLQFGGHNTVLPQRVIIRINELLYVMCFGNAGTMLLGSLRQSPALPLKSNQVLRIQGQSDPLVMAAPGCDGYVLFPDSATVSECWFRGSHDGREVQSCLSIHWGLVPGLSAGTQNRVK